MEFLDASTGMPLGNDTRSVRWHEETAWSPDRQVYARSHDGWLELLAPPLDTVVASTDDVEWFQFLPNGDLLVDRNDELVVWRAGLDPSRAEVLPHKPAPDVTGASLDGHVCCGWGSAWLVAWDTCSGRELVAVSAVEGWPVAHALSRDGKRFAVAIRGGVTVWDTSTGAVAAHIDVPGAQVLTIRFHPDGLALAFDLGASAVGVWNITAPHPPPEAAQHAQAVSQVRFSPDGATLATSDGASLHLWDVRTGVLLRSCGTPVDHMVFLGRGDRLACVGRKGPLQILDSAKLRERGRVPLAEDYVYGLRSNACGTRVVVEETRSLSVWDASGDEPRRIARLEEAMRPLFFVDEDRILAWGWGLGPCLWTPGRPGLVCWPLSDPLEAELGVSGEAALFFLMRGADRAGHTRWGTLWQHTVVLGQESLSVGISPGQRTEVAIGMDGRRLLLARGGMGAAILETATAKYLPSITADAGVESVDVSPDGETVALGLKNTTVLLCKMPYAEASDPIADSEALAPYWEDLGDVDPRRGLRAVQRLAATGDRAVRFIAEHWGRLPSTEVDVEDWIRLLDADHASTREAASSLLERLGRAAEEELRSAARSPASPESATRIEQLLKALECPIPSLGGDALRRLRAIEVIERVRSVEAISFLSAMASGPRGAPEVEQARGALARMARR